MVPGHAANDLGRSAVPAYPRRFRSAEARGARIGRPLRLFGRAGDVDEALLDRIGRAFFEEDDAGAALAAAMRLPAGTPGRVTHAQLRAALAGPGVGAGDLRGAGDREIGPSHNLDLDTEIGPLHRRTTEIGPLHTPDAEIGPLLRDRSFNRPMSEQGTDVGTSRVQRTDLSAAPRQPSGPGAAPPQPSDLGAALPQPPELEPALRRPPGPEAAPQHRTQPGTDLPEALRRFLDEVTSVPDWVDWDLIEEGAAVQRRLGQNAGDVLLQLSLVGGYRFGGPTDLLAATGALTGGTLRRLAETQEWTVGLSEPGALRPFAAAWRATAHVRAMHALVSASFADPVTSRGGRAAEPWDAARWGLPINQADQAATLGLFDGTLILGCRALGVRISPSDSRALMHLWKWVGHLLGVHPDFLVDDEWERHRISYHVLLAQAGISDAGPRLARAVVAAQAERTYRGPSWWQPFRAWFERERLLSMLTAFLGLRSMRELDLPLRPPWAHVYLLPLNIWRYHVRGRSRQGRERLERWGRRRSDAILASYLPEPHRPVSRRDHPGGLGG
jgi:hypothetical protein